MHKVFERINNAYHLVIIIKPSLYYNEWKHNKAIHLADNASLDIENLNKKYDIQELELDIKRIWINYEVASDEQNIVNEWYVQYRKNVNQLQDM